jgi:predicted NAD/FAD-binding protein
MTRQRIAVVGAGVAGVVAAHLLSREHDVVLFEAKNRLGGHTNTITITHGQDKGLNVDTGFIVYNDSTYPNFIRFLDDLGIKGERTDMSFSYSDTARNFAYAGTSISGLFAHRRNIFDPRFWGFLGDVARFCQRALQDLRAGKLEGITLSEYLDRIGAKDRLRRDYLAPMAQAIWSSPADEVLSYPASSFVRFFDNHGLLSLLKRVRWRYLKGGSRTYLDAFRERFPGEIRLATPIRSVKRTPEGPELTHDEGTERFDAVVLAAHADQSLAMLADPDEAERTALSPWRYSANHTVLHADPKVMPWLERAWACWNVSHEHDDHPRRPVRVTYWMNRLQRLTASRDYFVTLNWEGAIADTHLVYDTVYHHPVYTLESVATQTLLPELNGRRGTYFAGSYHGYGFHEDAVRSAVAVAKEFGIEP